MRVCPGGGDFPSASVENDQKKRRNTTRIGDAPIGSDYGHILSVLGCFQTSVYVDSKVCVPFYKH